MPGWMQVGDLWEYVTATCATSLGPQLQGPRTGAALGLWDLALGCEGRRQPPSALHCRGPHGEAAGPRPRPGSWARPSSGSMYGSICLADSKPRGGTGRHRKRGPSHRVPRDRSGPGKARRAGWERGVQEAGLQARAPCRELVLARGLSSRPPAAGRPNRSHPLCLGRVRLWLLERRGWEEEASPSLSPRGLNCAARCVRAARREPRLPRRSQAVPGGGASLGCVC